MEKDFVFTIPNSIATRPGLTLVEQVVLAKFATNPGCSTVALSAVTGLSVRGIEALLQRLVKSGEIVRSGSGRSRQYRVTFFESVSKNCGVITPEISPKKCGVRPEKELSTVDLWWLRRRMALSCMQYEKYSSAIRLLTDVRTAIASAVDLDQSQRNLLLTNIEDCITIPQAMQTCREWFPNMRLRDRKTLARALLCAPPKVLQRVREQMPDSLLFKDVIHTLLLQEPSTKTRRNEQKQLTAPIINV